VGAAVSTLDTSDIAEEKAETQWEIGDLISRVPAQPPYLGRCQIGVLSFGPVSGSSIESRWMDPISCTNIVHIAFLILWRSTITS
jgi:hypothetical protein